jgi:Type III restriction enzyme, res subunit
MGQNTSWQSANNPDVLQRILADAYGVSNASWRKSGTTYSTTAHSGLKISRVNGTWLVKDFSTATIGDDKARSAKNLLFHLYNLRSNQEAAEKLALLTGVNVEKEVDSYHHTDNKEPPKALGFYYPNTNPTGVILKKHAEEIVYCNWDTPIGQFVLHYVGLKTQADFVFIKKFIRPIARTTQNERVYNYTEKQFAYAVFEGQNARIFRPYLKAIGIDKMPLQDVGNYVFGFSHLPDDKNQCKLLVIVGGEHDCIAFNSAYNRFGWYAVTQGSETRNLKEELVVLLKKRCLRLMTFFDNDQAGAKGMDKQAREHGLQSIDLASFVNNKDVFTGCEFDVNNRNRTLNDICDVLGTEGGIEHLKKLIDRELTTKGIVQPLPYRPVFSNVFQTPINNYLGDTERAYLQLKNQIWLTQKSVLQSPTGSGKTYLMLVRLANDVAFFNLLDIERIVYLCPTNSLGQQQADAHKIPFISSIEKVNASEVSQSRVIAATFDQVCKMPKEWLDTSLFIPDEFHTLTSEFDYRAETMRCLLNLIQSAKYVLGITATPNLAFIKHLNFSLFIGTFEDKTKAQKINIQPILLNTGSAKDVLTNIESRRDQSKITILKFDDVNVLNAYQQVLTKIYGEAAVTVISSKTDAMSVNNAHYQSLMKTGRVGEGVEFVLCTRFLESGVNFEFPAEIFCIFPQATDSLLQMLARPRIDRTKGVNLAINTFVYIAKGAYRNKASLTELVQRFTAFTNGEPQALSEELLNHEYNLQAALRSNQDLCKVFNAQPEARGKSEYISNNDCPVILNPSTNFYEVDSLRIFHEKEATLQSLLRGDVVAFFAELKSVNPHVKIQDLEVVDLAHDGEVRKALTDISTAAIIEKEKAATHFANANAENSALTVAYFAAKDKNTRRRIETYLGHQPLPIEAESARERLGVNNTEDGAILSVTSQYLTLVETAQHVKYANGVQPIKTAEIRQKLPEILRGYDVFTNRLKRLAERLTADREQTTTRENMPVVLAGRISNEIRVQVFKYRADRRFYSTTDLFRLYNTAVQKAGESLCLKSHHHAQNFGVVKRRLEALFEVECSRKGKYRIGAEITAKNIFDCRCSEENELTTLT